MEDTNSAFEQRLKKYRESKGLLKYEFAKKLDISESFYNMIENGRKNPSKNFLIKLVAESKKPEEFWLYGIEENKYTNIKKNEGIFTIVHVQKSLNKSTNYIDYVCDTPREVLLLVNTLRMFASPVDENSYTIIYTDGKKEINYNLEDIEKLIEYSLESESKILNKKD
ncbi:helix-turn-helix domain-containing protein [Clostridium sulfidigenes]|uniref:helix-turn-helix domain-containing protein n=1 Tax=Clostridium sulfidigenes TaxID=318464 RepID=UPI003F8B8856